MRGSPVISSSSNSPLPVLFVERKTNMQPFHEMTQAELVRHLRSLYDAQPKANWDTLAVGGILMQKGRGWRITHIPPKRGFVMATNVMTGVTEKLLRSQYDGADLLVTDEATLAKLRTSHQDEIKKAMAVGVTISPVVQYDYPEIFTPYPAAWDEKRREKAHDIWGRINDMRAFRDHTEAPGWQLRRVAYLRREAKKDIARWEKYRAEVEAGVKIKKPEAIPRIVTSVDDTIRDLKEQITILNHLGKHLKKTVVTLKQA
jgi:hypothetical protein